MCGKSQTRKKKAAHAARNRAYLWEIEYATEERRLTPAAAVRRHALHLLTPLGQGSRPFDVVVVVVAVLAAAHAVVAAAAVVAAVVAVVAV